MRSGGLHWREGVNKGEETKVYRLISKINKIKKK